jgi:DNA mismatch repair ATPase MutL
LSTKPAALLGNSSGSEDLTLEDVTNIYVVGQLENKMYIVKIKNELFALDPYKVKEIILTRKSLQDLNLRPEPLDEPIRFEEDDLGNNLFFSSLIKRFGMLGDCHIEFS